MQQSRRFKWRQLWEPVCLTMVLLVVFNIFHVSDVDAAVQQVNVVVTMGYVTYTDCGDLIGPPDIYFEVKIDGVSKNNYDNQIDPNIWPAYSGAQFTQAVDLSKGTIPIEIRMWDADLGSEEVCGFCSLGDAIDLSLNLSTCSISGEVTGQLTGQCKTEFSFWGCSGGGLDFTIEVVDPAHVPGLNVRCMHDPIWPQPGKPVTITAEALDDDANLITAGKVDDIEIWIDDKTKPYATTAPSGVNTTSVKYTPPSGAEQFTYGCRVLDDGLRVFTGWRVVQIGQPKKGRAVPILYTGPRDSRVDIVFIADDLSFTGGNDPLFLTEVHDLIRDGYYAGMPQNQRGGRLFLVNQDVLNLWIALDQGNIDPATTIIRPPDNWYKDYNFAEAGALLHRYAGLRDRARRNVRIFSTDITGLPSHTMLHETGHTPFGLSDEYCDSKLTYVVADPYPNTYDSQTKCLADPLASTIQNACQQIQEDTSSHPKCKVNYYRLDDATTYFDDLMTSYGNLTPNPADKRRVDWLFDKCRSASCD